MKEKTKELADSVGAVYPTLFLGRHDGVLFTETELETFVELVAAAEREAPDWLLIKNILAEYGLDAIAFVAEWKAAQQQAEPPQREWQGLTNEDWVAIDNKKGTALDTFQQGAVWAESQLRERNT